MSLVDELTEGYNSAVQYFTGGDVQVFVKTNYGPELPVFTGFSKSDQPGIADLIGLKKQLIIKNKEGKVLTTYGDPAPTDPIKQAIVFSLLVLVVVIVAWILWRAFAR